MTLPLLARRAIVIVAVVGATIGGAASIRAAGIWTAASAPLAVAPASLTSIDAALAAEKQRSAALEAQLTSISSAAADLEAALAAAQDQVTTDATTADRLRADLAAARGRLTALEKALAKAAKAKPPVTGGSSTVAPPKATPEPHDD